MNKFLSRKFVLCLLTLACSTWLALDRIIAAGDYKAVVLGTVGVYVIGNVAQKSVVKDAGAEK